MILIIVGENDCCNWVLGLNIDKSVNCPIHLIIVIHFYTDEETIDISPTIVGLAMTSSLKWSKFSAILSPDTTKESEGENIYFCTLFIQEFWFDSFHQF
jgi:hypothetical protein